MWYGEFTVHLITKLIAKLHILFTAFDKTPEDMKLEIKINANRGCLWTHTVIQFLQIKVRELSDHARSRQNDKLTSSCSQQKEKKVNLMISLTWAKLFPNFNICFDCYGLLEKTDKIYKSDYF